MFHQGRSENQNGSLTMILKWEVFKYTYCIPIHQTTMPPKQCQLWIWSPWVWWTVIFLHPPSCPRAAAPALLQHLEQLRPLQHLDCDVGQ
jgi:hypothetical protein